MLELISNDMEASSALKVIHTFIMNIRKTRFSNIVWN